MANFVVTPNAWEDLDEIWKYIARDNPSSAAQVVDAAFETFRILANNPGIGRPRNFKRKAHRNIRSRSIRGFHNYLILYREVTGGIEVLHVYHAARNIDALMRKK